MTCEKYNLLRNMVHLIYRQKNTLNTELVKANNKTEKYGPLGTIKKLSRVEQQHIIHSL